LAETLARRAVLSHLLTSKAPSAAIGGLGLRDEDEPVVRAELARYGDKEMPLRERSDRLARAYVTSRRDEDQRTRLAIEAERATLRTDTHARIVERLSDDGRRKWLARIDDARTEVMAAPPPIEAGALGRSDARLAASATVTGRLLQVTCDPVLILEVGAGATRLRLILEDPAAVTVLGKSGGRAELQCGEQDVPVQVGYDPVVGAANGTQGVVRVIDYRQP
jgi:hypothetical protein